MQYQKPKSASKRVTVKGPALEKVILETMGMVSAIVGATLGPGGQPILIEREEHGLAPTVTKDGVSCFMSLGDEDSTRQCILETARDAATRTAGEAGDGTTTATVLAEAIVRHTHKFCKANARISPQKVVRRLEKAFKDTIEPLVRSLAIKADLSTEAGRNLLLSVAQVSANGDSDLAQAVLACYDTVGDDGNVTITEVNGPSRYEVERVEGYPINIGYEDCCGQYYPKFINDPANQRCVMDNPVFVVYHGRITEIQTLVILMEKIGQAWAQGGFKHHNVVLVSTGFSETVLGQLALNFAEPTTINVFPLLTPRTPQSNGQLQLLEDLCAITGATLFDPMNRPLDTAGLHELGPGVKVFEAGRSRANVVGHAEGPLLDLDCTPLVSPEGEPLEGIYEDLLLVQIDHVQTQVANAESELDRLLLQERLGKLTGGIAKLKVIGSSNGETKEKRDRAEDAVCSVRGAIKHGCLPGGGWTLLRLIYELNDKFDDQIIQQVLMPSLQEPVTRLLSNCGLHEDEIREVLQPIKVAIREGLQTVYDALEGVHVDPVSGGILDSVPAVLEAIRNALSIASQLGTTGGIVAFVRDHELDRSEARATQAFLRDANTNEANERL